MIKAILFDVDGVLVDSLRANFIFYSRVMRGNGYRAPALSEYRKLFHLPLAEAIASLSKEKSKKRLKSTVDKAIVMREEIYPMGKVKIPDGAKRAIASLSRHYKIGIATSRRKKDVKSTIDAFYGSGRFDVIISREDYKSSKPSPDSLRVAAKRLQLREDEIIYVGDSPTDIQAAHAAGMRAIGYSNKHLAGADKLVSSFEKIPEAVRELGQLGASRNA